MPSHHPIPAHSSKPVAPLEKQVNKMDPKTWQEGQVKTILKKEQKDKENVSI